MQSRVAPVLVNFVDFWPSFDRENNYFIDLLRSRFDVELSDRPELLFYSVFGEEYRRYRCTRVFFSGEAYSPDRFRAWVAPNFHECDYSFSFDYIKRPEHYRLPLYGLYCDPKTLIRSSDYSAEDVLRKKTRFCNFVYSNPRAPERERFFHLLSRYKRVDSGGRYLNNIGEPVDDKLSFIANYKFTIAFEHSSRPGYTTEKLLEPLRVGSVPIYWGNPLAGLDFNPQSFVGCHSFSDFEQVAKHVIAMDQDDDLYLETLRQTPWSGNVPNGFVKRANVLAQLERIVTTPKRPVAQSRRSRALATAARAGGRAGGLMRRARERVAKLARVDGSFEAEARP